MFHITLYCLCCCVAITKLFPHVELRMHIWKKLIANEHSREKMWSLSRLVSVFPRGIERSIEYPCFSWHCAKVKTLTTCWLAHLTFILWKWFSCMWQCWEMWTSDVKRQVIFMCLVLFPHGEVQIFKWKKAINYEKMSFTCENVHSCMEIVTNMWHYFHFPCENGQIASVIFPRGSWRQRILSFGWHFAFFRMAWQECRQEICTNATQTKT